MRRVLSVASECVPLAKTGGLADVVGALPRALGEVGWEQRVLIPAYPGLLAKTGPGDVVWEDPWLFGGRGTVRKVEFAGLDLLLLDAPHLFDRPGGGLYSDGVNDYPDNHSRFASLSWVAAMISLHGSRDGWRPAVLHAHDWQAGLAPAYVRFAGGDVGTVFTIHNVAFQGVFGLEQGGWLRIPLQDLTPGSLEYHGHLSTLKAGIVHADKVNTVSPTYAEELKRPEFGFGMEGPIAARGDDFSGIVNGVDTSSWNPETDPNIVNYTPRKRSPKKENRKALLEEFHLDPKTPGPVAVVVTRLTHQKGIDLLLDAAHVLLERGGALIVLGSGEPQYEQYLHELMWRHLGRVGVYIGYNEPLSHRMFGGGDITIVPSRYEPCGLTQLYGLRYGTIPVVAATGGLADTVVHANEYTLENRTATGVHCYPHNGDSLKWALSRVCDLYEDRPTWTRMVSAAMKTPVDWGPSARRYAELYEQVAGPGE